MTKNEKRMLETLKHIAECASECVKGLDGYEMILEWARKAIDEVEKP